MKDLYWLLITIAILAVVGLVSISPENRWWWFLLFMPGFVAIWMFSSRLYKKH